MAHLDIITDFAVEFNLKSNSIAESSLFSFKRSFKYLKQEGKLERLNISTLNILKKFLIQKTVVRTESSAQAASERTILRCQTQRDLLLYEKAKTITSDYHLFSKNF